MYLEAMEKVLAKVRKYVLDEKAGAEELDLRFLVPKN
jgi:hypothetical protein